MRLDTHLSTQLEVGHYNGHLRTGDDEYQEHKKQESKEVIELVLPDGLQRMCKS